MDTKDGLAQLIQEQKQQTFTDPAKATDAEALGVLIAHWAEWDGQAIVEAFCAALEDANYHALNGKIAELWEQDCKEADAAVENVQAQQRGLAL